MKPAGYWFKSSKFDIESGEDREINPGIYGRQLARWLRARLQERGYAVEGIINEDWGRCLMCGRDPFMLWVGCANLTEDDDAIDASTGEARPPSKEDIVWHCFAAAEVPFLKSWLRKIDTTPALTKLDRDLGEILRAEPAISLVPEP
jgi:hypothetical protein